jgi:aspartate aminotransferase
MRIRTGLGVLACCITGTGLSSGELAARLLQDAGVAALSGTAFGTYGEGLMRFSYGNSVENINLALDAVRTHLAEAPVPA